MHGAGVVAEQHEVAHQIELQPFAGLEPAAVTSCAIGDDLQHTGRTTRRSSSTPDAPAAGRRQKPLVGTISARHTAGVAPPSAACRTSSAPRALIAK